MMFCCPSEWPSEQLGHIEDYSISYSMYYLGKNSNGCQESLNNLCFPPDTRLHVVLVIMHLYSIFMASGCHGVLGFQTKERHHKEFQNLLSLKSSHQKGTVK